MGETETTPEQGALQSLLDIVEELCLGLAAGQVPEPEWAEIVADTLRKHKRELRGEQVDWDET